MASHDYYHPGQGDQQRPPYAASTPSPAPYYQANNIPTPSPQSTPAPPYQADYASPSSVYPPTNYPTTSSPISGTAQQQQHQSPYGQQPPPPSQSPFDSVFDDNAYPMHSNTRPGYQTSQSGDIGQQGFYQDTSYQGGAYNNRPLNSQDDIPLQDRPGKDPEMNDHIYDAPGAAGDAHKKKKKGKVRLGELGMIGANKKRIPWVVYLFTIIQIAVFIGELVKNGILTKSPIAIKPQFNPMIGPSPAVLVNMGARYSLCMHNVRGYQTVAKDKRPPILCPWSTGTDIEKDTCQLDQVCGFGFPESLNPPDNAVTDLNNTPAPNQWYRFIIPIFMHAGLIHIGFNLLMQLTIAKDMERAIGSIRFFIVYMSAGIFGFVMSGLFTPPLISSTGASGSLFGIMALTLLDLLYSWKDRRNPVKDLLFVVLDMVISFVLGLLPGLDNFAHIGGFITGIAVGVCVLHSPNSLRRRMGQELSYSAVSEGTGETPPAFYKNPVGFFKGRKPLWWIWWLLRAGMLVLIIVSFIVMLNNFYVNQPECDWCKYLSCIDVNGWCEWGTIKTT